MTGTVQLESSAYLNACSGRPEFQIRMKRGWGGPTNYQVFGLEKGMLLLNLGSAAASAQFDGTLGAVGGILGGRCGRLLGDAFEKASETTQAQADNTFVQCSDSQLVQKAREYKGSLVVSYDEVVSVAINKPGMMDAWTRGGVVAALISLREETLGKMTWEICDQQSLVTAFEFLPAKFKDKVQVNMQFDPESLKYV